MNAEIIAVGSELLTPQRLDTNSLFLTAKLNELGVELAFKCVVGDDRARLATTVAEAVARSGIVILTGGLGPTEDDVTRDAVAAALGRTLEFRDELLEQIRARFAQIRRRMADINRRQAYLVEGGEALPNPNGTAPGQWIPVGEGQGAVILLPGPPRELEPMFLNHCLPRLAALVPKQVLRTLFWRVAGMGESDLDALIAPVYTKYANPVTTILAKLGDVEIHLRARAETDDEAKRLIDQVAAQIGPLLGDRVYSRDGAPLEEVVGRRLLERGESVAVAESCTAGLLGSRITAVAGSSRYFRGGFLTYTDEIKTALLGIDAELLRAHTAVSEPVAAAMAEAARERTGATWGVSVTGYAGPGNGAGTLYIGVAGAAPVTVRRLQFGGDRERVRTLAVQYGLDLLRRALE